MSKEPSKFAHRYDEAFKRQTVEWIDTQQRSKRELSRELGVSEWSLSRWCKQYGKEAAAGSNCSRSAPSWSATPDGYGSGSPPPSPCKKCFASAWRASTAKPRVVLAPAPDKERRPCPRCAPTLPKPKILPRFDRLADSEPTLFYLPFGSHREM